MFTETEYCVLVHRPELAPDKRTIVKSRLYGLGDALHSATSYAEGHPEHIVTIYSQFVVRGEYEPVEVFDYTPPVKEDA